MARCDLDLLLMACNHTYAIYDAGEAKKERDYSSFLRTFQMPFLKVLHQSLSIMVKKPLLKPIANYFLNKIQNLVRSNLQDMHKTVQEKLKSELAIEKRGYTCRQSAAEQHGVGYSILKPKDNEGPIILAFRGTSNFADIKQDVNIAREGITHKKHRREAFDIFKKLRAENPGREIVLTGHSLGGNLAQYVGIMHAGLMNKYPLYAKNYAGNCLIRTFNTAPIQLQGYESLFTPSAGQFANYRLLDDPVSEFAIKAKSTIGTVHTYPSHLGALKALDIHSLNTIRQHLPEHVRKIAITSDPHSLTQEIILGHLASYRSSVKTQFASGIRAGKKKAARLDELDGLLQKEPLDWEKIQSAVFALNDQLIQEKMNPNSKFAKTIGAILHAVNAHLEHIQTDRMQTTAQLSHS